MWAFETLQYTSQQLRSANAHCSKPEQRDHRVATLEL